MPSVAHDQAKQRHPQQCNKIQVNEALNEYVFDGLTRGWSPEQISGRMKCQKLSFYVCHETIYQFIYRSKNKELYHCLVYKKPHRQQRYERHKQSCRYGDIRLITQRPEAINARKRFGHWEGDSIVGDKHTSGLHTEYERVSSLTRIERVSRLTAQEAVAASLKIFGPLPDKARRSTTLDNGSENTKHTEVKEACGIQAYFADPYSSWQRGGNENCNLWIRYYFPKGTDFSTISDEEVKDVEWELNNRPKKRLNFKTPQEVFTEYLNRP